MSPASNKAVPSSGGMRAVASPPPRPHGHRPPEWAASPPPLPQQSPAMPRGRKAEVGSQPTSPHPFTPSRWQSGVGRCQTPPEREGHHMGSRAAVPLRHVPGALRRRKQGCPRPRDHGSPRALPAGHGPCQDGALLHAEQGRGWHAARSPLRPLTASRAGAAQVWSPAAILAPAHSNARSGAPHQPGELPAASGAGNALGTEATHGPCSQPSRRSLSQPACGCRWRAMQQVKRRRGASNGLGQGPRPAWPCSALLRQPSQAGTGSCHQLGRGQAPCNLPQAPW